jgi:hypothetical protein
MLGGFDRLIQTCLMAVTFAVANRPQPSRDPGGTKMCSGEITSKERRRDLAGLFAKLLFQSLQHSCSLPGKWRVESYAPDKIDEERSGSLMEVRLVKWPPRFRLSIHSDDGGSVVGYGVFRPSNMNRRSNDDGLREYLERRVSRKHPTRVHWALYADMEEPLRDFSRHETLIEVDKIRRRETSEGYAAMQRASEDLVMLAEALDGWYSEGQQHPADRNRRALYDSFGKSR